MDNSGLNENGYENSFKDYVNHILSYGISNPFQLDFGLPLISQHNLRLMDIIDPHQFIDVGLL